MKLLLQIVHLYNRHNVDLSVVAFVSLSQGSLLMAFPQLVFYA